MSISRATVDSLTAILDGSGNTVGQSVKVKTDGASTAVTAINPGYGVFVGDRVYVDSIISKDAKGGKLIIVGTTADNLHFVGATGEIGYLNSWAPYTTDALHKIAQYHRDPSARVHLAGAMMSGTAANQISGTGAGVAFVLPAGNRPLLGLVFETHSGTVATGGLARVNVNSDGGVCVSGYSGGGSNALVSLSGISFKAEQ